MVNISNAVILFLILFIGLKISEVINWPWIWALSPIWIPGIIIFTIIFFFGSIYYLYTSNKVKYHDK